VRFVIGKQYNSARPEVAGSKLADPSDSPYE